MRYNTGSRFPKIFFHVISLMLFFLFFFSLPAFVFADVPCNGTGESCGSACAEGYTNIGYCANSFGFLGTKLICCKEGAPPATPTIRSEPGTSTTPTTPTTSATPGTTTAPATPATTTAPGATTTPATPATPAASTADTSGSLVPCTDNCNLCDIVMGIKRIFKYLGTLLVIVATLFIIIAGIAYMVSGGSKNLMEWAKKALMYALIGFVLYLASWLIVGSILTAMGYNRSGWSTFDCETSSGTGE